MTLIRTERPAYPTFSGMLDRFFNDDFFTDLRQGSTNLPAVNMAEHDDHYLLELAVPGMKKGDFKIEVDNNLLTISSHQEENQEQKDDQGYFRREFNYRSFKRSFSLPEGKVDDAKIKARYEDGVLQVHLPKSKEALPTPPKMIEVK